MSQHKVGYVSSEQLLFLSPWKPVETDTTSLENRTWECPNCARQRTYFRSLARLEGGEHQFMVQCPSCDHLIVVEMKPQDSTVIRTRYGGPHIDSFLRFLDERSQEEE